MKSTSVFFHGGYKFDLSPMKILKVNNNDGVINMTIENKTDTGGVIMPCTAIIDGPNMKLMTIDGNCINVRGEQAVYGGDR